MEPSRKRKCDSKKYSDISQPSPLAMVKGSHKTARTPRTVDLLAVQCHQCYKWRQIATEEEFEEIRSKILEDPFFCSKKTNVSCNDPADLEYDSTRIWMLDKPNLPKTPTGFKRRVVLRSDHSKIDIYYLTPTGKSLRSSPEVASFLKRNPQYKDLSISNFSFTRPKVMKNIPLGNMGEKAVVPSNGDKAVVITE